MRLILASASPRRREILVGLGCAFTAEKSTYLEDNSLPMPPKRLAMHHALEKARDVAKRHRSGVILGVDTFVVFNNIVQGKPKSSNDAARILCSYSKKKAAVVSGIAIIDLDKKREAIGSEVTNLYFSEISGRHAKTYVELENLLDYAGAFTVTGKGALIVKRFNGCFYNVLGLPLSRIEAMLNTLGHSLIDNGQKTGK